MTKSEHKTYRKRTRSSKRSSKRSSRRTRRNKKSNRRNTRTKSSKKYNRNSENNRNRKSRNRKSKSRKSKSRNRKSKSRNRKSKSRKNSRKQRGSGLSADDLRQRYNMPASVEQEEKRKGRNSEDIKILEKNNINKCKSTRDREIIKCDSLIALPGAKQNCKKDASLIIEGITKLTSTYSTDMMNIINKCGDKNMTEKELAKCERDIAEKSQEYVAQCSTFANGIEAKYGKKTFEGRKATAVGYIKKITDILPGQKSKKEKAALEKGMKLMVESWIKNCEGNQKLEKTGGMERYSFSCKDIRSKRGDQLEPFIKELLSGVTK